MPSRASAVPPAVSDLRGVVVDSTTGERLTAVNVRIAGTPMGGVTNPNGFFLVPSVPPGNYRLVVSVVGYERKEVPVRIAGGEPVTLTIRLRPRPIESSEVTVESEAITEMFHAGTPTHLVTPQSVMLMPATVQEDLLRSIQMLPGISSTSDVSAAFYVRGGARDQNLILLDGMKVYNPFHASGTFSILDPGIIKSAEIHTGSFPAGYGGRLSSVVDVRTRDGNSSRLAGSAGINFLSGSIELEGPVQDDNSWLISARRSLFDQSLKKIIPNPAPTTFYDLFVKGTIGTSTGRTGLRGFISGDDIRPDDPVQPDHVWRSSAFAYSMSGVLTDRIYLDAVASYSAAEVRREPKQGSGILPASSELSEVSVRTEMTFYTEGRDSWLGGFEFSFPSYENHLPISQTSDRIFKDSDVEVWIWGRYQSAPGPVTLDAGVHCDVVSFASGSSVLQGLQPRVTLGANIVGNWFLKGSVAVVTQSLVTITNEDDLISLFEAWVYPPKSLRPEEARHYVVGIEGNIAPPLYVSVQGYLKDFRSIVLYNRDKVFATEPDYLLGTGEARGVEAMARYHSPLLDILASYALAYVRVSSNDITYAPRYDRQHSLKAMATVHLPLSLDATVRWEYGSGYPYTQNAGYYDRIGLGQVDTETFPSGVGEPFRVLGEKNGARLPSYHRIDIGVQHHFSLAPFHGTIGVSLVNIENARNILYYDRITGKTDYMIPFYPSASLRVEF